VIKSG